MPDGWQVGPRKFAVTRQRNLALLGEGGLLA
jgi:hypothetical protein